jgi:anti-anti-sigma factor
MAELEPRVQPLVVETAVQAGGEPVIRVAGDLDIASVDELKAAVSAALVRRPESLTFEVSGMRFMDSAGIAVLLGAVSAVQTVRLRSPSPAVTRLLELTGLTGVLEVER